MQDNAEASLTDEDLMTEALRLASTGGAFASPDPMSACFIQSGPHRIASGFATYGHNPVVSSVAKAGLEARGATAYLTSEPSDERTLSILIGSGVARIVGSAEDPRPEKGGVGYDTLRQAGITVDTGILAAKANHLNRAHTKFIRSGIPYVTMLIETDPGIELRPNSASWEHLMLMRHAHDVIVTDVDTVRRTDEVFLDQTGLPRGRPLMRVLLDPELVIPGASRLVASWNNDLIVLSGQTKPDIQDAIRGVGIAVEILAPDDDRCNHWKLRQALKIIAGLPAISVLVEACSDASAEALAEGLVDEVCVFHKLSEPPPITTNCWPSLAKPRTRALSKHSDEYISVYRLG